jgi:hypothetical protein
MAGLMPVSGTSSYSASQQLMDVLQRYRFAEVSGMGGKSMREVKEYVAGRNYYFRKHGQCTVNLLKDGRVHVLYGPIAMWNLHDSLTQEELTILIAFATMGEEHQDCMRNYMGPKCTKFMDVLHQMPRFQVDWKHAFLEAYSQVHI